MSLKKSIKIDKIEIVGEHKILQIREATIVEEDSVELSRSFHRYTLSPNQDISSEPKEVQDITKVVWTDDIKSSYNNKIKN